MAVVKKKSNQKCGKRRRIEPASKIAGSAENVVSFYSLSMYLLGVAGKVYGDIGIAFAVSFPFNIA